MSDDNNNNDSNTDNQLVFDDDDEAFVDLNHAVEVEVGENGDEDVPMDDDDDDDDDDGQVKDDNANNNANDANNNSIIKDMSIQTITSHKPSSVFTVSSHMNKSTNTLSIITGGGDDKAYLHKIDNNNNLQSMLLNHAHTDSVSCVDTNESFVSKDLKKTPKYIAVGAYDGSIVLYNPDTGDKIQVLDGPTDVEFVAFHPKGGSVSLLICLFGYLVGYVMLSSKVLISHSFI
jgi:WD40 repeat protein